LFDWFYSFRNDARGIALKKEFTVIIEQDEEGNFVSQVPGLPGCHTQAKSMDDLLQRTREAIALCLEVYN
jgi:predicted RNase H-like HicB family nuclease